MLEVTNVTQSTNAELKMPGIVAWLKMLVLMMAVLKMAKRCNFGT